MSKSVEVSGLLIIPAIDIKGGRCVRLKQGQMNKETVYSDHPEDIAAKWIDLGAKRIHIVDLDGAIGGKPVNGDVIGKIMKSVSVPVQLGGGIRDIETIDAYLTLGLNQVILGTAAYRNPDLIKLACKRYPNNIILGMDARNGQLAVEGWTEKTTMSPIQMAKTYESLEIYAIVYTDINRDGMSTGPNIETTRELAGEVSLPVIASGGISNIKDVSKLLELASSGVIGMITGRALYEGTLDLSEAINLIKSKEKP